MKYPKILSEHETLELAHSGVSIARYGDGEYNLCQGKKCVSQPFDKSLAAELRQVLLSDDPRILPCIPNALAAGTKPTWVKYTGPDICALLRDRVYGSSFISRPDSAPWIDTEAYWNRVRDLWRGKDVVLAIGTQRSLREDMLSEAASVRVVLGPSGQKGDGAYAKIDQIEEEIGRPSGPVLLCLGATATVLAARLARKGLHGLDLGHIGMFLRSAGAYRYKLDDLISPAYRHVLAEMHARGKWGGDGAKHVKAVRALADEMQPETILDYGCGEGALAEAMKPRRVSGFDPGMPGKEGMPKPCELVVCCDVLEHVELEKLPDVFGHLRSVTLKAAYAVIATRPAKAVLPDGRNAHLIVKAAEWWIRGLEQAGWTVERQDIVEGKEVRLWLKK